MQDRTPFHFRPMFELDHQERVEMCLASGRCLIGWMLVGGVSPKARSYWTQADGGAVRCIAPIGWRELITPAVLAAWKESEAA